MTTTEKYDDLFLTMAGQLGDVESLLSTFFSFLNRKTDLYVVWDSFDPKSDKSMGFPKGKAEELVLKAFKSFKFRSLKPSKEGNDKKTEKSKTKLDSLPPLKLSDNPFDNSTKGPPKTSEAPSSGPSSTKSKPIGNGGLCPEYGYYWIQTLNDVTIYVDVPSGIHAKDLLCSINAKNISAQIKNSRGKTLLSGEFPNAVKKDESIWNLEIGEETTLVIVLEKAIQTWWASAIMGHPEIDTSQVDSTCKVSDYDEETQATIRKLMFDQKQKRLGLPTSDQLEHDRMLEIAKTAPGSPFLPGGPFYQS